MESTGEERVAFVTGAARGIGQAVAEALAARGVAVAVADRLAEQAGETAAAIEASGGRAVGVAVDVTDSAAVQAAIAQAEEQLGGPVDILVNVAGWDELMPFVKTTEPFWDKVIDINYKGVLRTTHAVLPGMLERGHGRIVNIASDAGRVGSSMEAVYAGAKAGVIAFTKTVAREVARKGVTANVVCPGPTRTPMLEEVIDAAPDAEKVVGAMTAAVPMKRLGEPADIAAAVCYFASPEASFTTGQTLSVSGGLTMA